jgi:hypothetical protein
VKSFEILGVMAQLGIALAGFSSIVVVVRRAGDAGRWLSEDVFRFKLMLQFGLASAGLAVLPGILSGFARNQENMWRGLDLAMGLALVFSFLSTSRAGKQIERGRLSTPIFVINSVAMAAALVLQFLGVIDVVAAANAYVAAVASSRPSRA